jgi:hypothetical protein
MFLSFLFDQTRRLRLAAPLTPEHGSAGGKPKAHLLRQGLPCPGHLSKRSIRKSLDPVARNIGQLIVEIVIYQFPVGCQGVAGAAGPADKIYRPSCFQDLKPGAASSASKRFVFHN